MTTLRVAIYARYSSEMQSPRSIDDQLRECREHAERQGWAIALVEADAATRAAALAGRDGFARVKAAAERGEIDLILVHELSRISRNFGDGIGIAHEMAKLGVALADTRFGQIDIKSQVGQMFLAMGFSQSQAETEKLADRSKRGLKGKVLGGFSAGGQPPYGFEREPVFSEHERDRDGRPKRIGVRFKHHPVEAVVVRRIFDEYARGESKWGIARGLTADGVPTRRAGKLYDKRVVGGAWQAATVKGILENEIHIGHYVWQRTARSGPPHPSGKKAQIATPTTAWARIDNFAEPIVDRALWDVVQARLAADAAEYAASHTGRLGVQYVLSGLVRCAVCGSAFSLSARRSGASAYACGMARRGATACSNGAVLPRVPLEERVKGALDAMSKDPAQLAVLVRDHNARIGKTNDAQRGTIAALEAKRDRLVAERDRFVDAIGAGGGAVAILVAKLKEREQQLAEAEAQIADAERTLQPLLLPTLISTEAFDTGEQSFFDGEYLHDREFIERVVESILVYGDGAIVMRFREDGLFSPVVETRFGALEQPTGSLGARRRLAADLARDTAEWAGNAPRRILDASGLPAVQVLGTAPAPPPGGPGGDTTGARGRSTSAHLDAARRARNGSARSRAARNYLGKTVNVPRGIRTLVATVKGWSPGPLDDGDGGPGRWAVQGSNLRPSG